MGFFVVASLTIDLVGDFLYSDRKQHDVSLMEDFSITCTDLFCNGQYANLQKALQIKADSSNGRLLLTDAYGKVQFDSQSESNGMSYCNRESSSVLFNGQLLEYGIHSSGDQSISLRSFLFAEKLDEWYSCCAVAICHNNETIGALIYLSSVTDIILSLIRLEKNIVFCFLAATAVAIIVSLILSSVITRPLSTLTKGIRKMSGGDFSVRVPEKGNGEIRRLSEAFNTMSEKLETLDTSRNQFVSNASHELKTPLATMKILMENIIYQPDMEIEIRTEFLTDINKEIDRLSLIVNDLLTLVSMDTNSVKLSRTTFAFSQIIEETVHRLLPFTEKKNQTLETVILDHCDMYADYSKLSQVVYNLTENAVKYTQEGGTIAIKLERSGKDAIFTVQDNGPGIPKQDQPHIFDRFYRVDKARSRETGGTGLGLSIVHQMVLMHGGRISVISEEGNGTLFTVELPIHQA